MFCTILDRIVIILVRQCGHFSLALNCIDYKHQHKANLLTKYCQIMTIIARNEQNSGKLKN